MNRVVRHDLQVVTDRIHARLIKDNHKRRLLVEFTYHQRVDILVVDGPYYGLLAEKLTYREALRWLEAFEAALDLTSHNQTKEPPEFPTYVGTDGREHAEY